MEPIDDPARSAMADMVAGLYPTSAMTEAAARSRRATRRWPRFCCGVRRGATSEHEGTLAFYHTFVRVSSYFVLALQGETRVSVSGTASQRNTNAAAAIPAKLRKPAS